MKIAIITQDAKAFKKTLVTNAPSPMEYAAPKPPEVLEEDKEIEAYPLKIDEGEVKIVKADGMFVR